MTSACEGDDGSIAGEEGDGVGTGGAGCDDPIGVLWEGEVSCRGREIAGGEGEAACGGGGAEESVIGERGERGRRTGDVGDVDPP